MGRKFLDVYVDYKVVETIEITHVENTATIKSELLNKYSDKGNIVVRKRTAPAEVVKVSGGCEGGSCPVHTKMVEPTAPEPVVDEVKEKPKKKKSKKKS